MSEARIFCCGDIRFGCPNKAEPSGNSVPGACVNRWNTMPVFKRFLHQTNGTFYRVVVMQQLIRQNMAKF